MGNQLLFNATVKQSLHKGKREIMQKYKIIMEEQGNTLAWIDQGKRGCGRFGKCVFLNLDSNTCRKLR